MTNESDKPGEKDIGCLEAFDHLYAYLNNEITNPVDLANVEHHLAHCKSCFSRAQMERELNQRMKVSGQEKLPESLKRRLRHLIDEL
jgi:anti-sigma factor (TIGR02949 family)